MKKTLLIFGIIALVGAIGFGLSVYAVGVKDNNYSVSIGGQKFIAEAASFGGEAAFKDGGEVERSALQPNTEYSHTFKSGVPSDISISVTSADTKVVCDDVEYVQVTYKTADRTGITLDAELSDGKLVIKEEKPSLVFGVEMTKSSTLTVTLPERTYGSVEFKSMSGNISSEGIECKDFRSSMVSGSGDHNIYAENIKAEMTSGGLSLKNCTDKPVNTLTVQSISGTANVYNFIADSISLSSMSGKLNAYGVGGNVSLKSTSGSSDIELAEWTGDLEIKKTSGSTNVKLPAGAGAELTLKSASGGVTVADGGTVHNYSGSTSATISGGTSHRIDIEIVSGGVDINFAQ